MYSHPDIEFMAQALKLARKGRFTTSPNPNVGCVIVKDGVVVGKGFHQKAGGPHAEVHALNQAGEKAKGATCYVTLEPCSHYGRTPPCAEGLIKAGVAKVIAAMEDPNPRVSGRGIQMLLDAGIEAYCGLLESQAKAVNLGFIKRMQGNGPLVQCKLACTLDGKTALANGESKWITAGEARLDVQKHRAQSCAIISGADTVITDDASLNVRLDYASPLEVRQPIRVIIDTQNRLTADLKLFTHPHRVILIRQTLDKSQQWPHFVEQICVNLNNDKADLTVVLAILAEMGCNQIWLEAGATLAGAFMAQQLVDELIIYQAPKLIGNSGRGLMELGVYSQMKQIPELDISDVRQVGRDIKITAKPIYQELMND